MTNVTTYLLSKWREKARLPVFTLLLQCGLSNIIYGSYMNFNEVRCMSDFYI